jgi:GT2 family glycosyltransferase
MKKTLEQLYRDHTGKVSDKWSIYLTEYDRLFEAYRESPINFLEIGIQNGGSLEIWSEFFPVATNLVGCDINSDCSKLRYAEPRISIVVGDANTDEIELAVRKISPMFDIVIDDGSHRSSDIVKSFARYFQYVTDGGLFVAEDLHCSYWQDYEGGLFYPMSSIGFFKRLADVVSHEHWGVPRPRTDVLRSFFTEYGCAVDEDTLAKIHSVEFTNSICVIRKKSKTQNELGPRIIAGKTADVMPVVLNMHGTLSATSDQTHNPWAVSKLLPEEELIQYQAQVKSLNLAVSNQDEKIAHLQLAVDSITMSRSWRLTQPLRWIASQVRQLRAQGLKVRLRALVRKIFRKIAGGGIAYIKARPALRMRLYGIAMKMGLTQTLRTLYDQLQVHVTEDTAEFRRQVVLSYPLWVETFDTPSAEALAHLAKSSETIAPVDIVAHFDLASVHHAVELAQKLQTSVGLTWRAIFLFAPDVNSVEIIKTVQQATKDDARISFDSQQFVPCADVVILIEGGVILRPHALRLFTDALRLKPNVLLAYADEDQINETGSTGNPWFKPQFSPLLISQGVLLGRMFAIRSAEQDIVSFWKSLVAGSADIAAFGRKYALNAGANRVVHIPHVLFHDAVLPQPPLKIKWTLPDVLPIVSVIIPTRDRWDLLGPCLQSLLKTDWPIDRLEITVVDNGSTDNKTLNKLTEAESAGHIKVVKDDREFNWSRLNNLAAKCSRGELLVFLNNDTEVADPSWLKKLAVQALDADVGAVGCKLLYEDRTVQHGGVIAGIQGVAGHAHMLLQANEGGYRDLATITHEVSAVTGACLMVTRANFELVGGFDENFRIAFNDVVFCFTLHEMGKRNVYVADPLFIHYESKSRGYDDTPVKLALQQAEARKAWAIHARLMREDPLYSPNLSLLAPYELSFAPRRKLAWDDRSTRPLRVMMLSNTHAIGHGVAVVVALQAEAFVKRGYEVIIAGPRTALDFPYVGCRRVEVHDPLSAAFLAARSAVDIIVAHTPPFFSVARWTGAHPPVIAYDYGEPPPEWFPDESARRAVLAEKDQALMMATAVYAISEAIAAESRTPVDGVIPLGNAHLGQWSDASNAKRQKVREARGWGDCFVVLNVCRFHQGERHYKGINLYADVQDSLQALDFSFSKKVVFVLCGKGTQDDIAVMSKRGLVVAANVTNEEMSDLYCAADVYMNFSQWEGYNLGIGQALAMGLPTLASDIPAHRAFGIDIMSVADGAAKWILETSIKNPSREPRVWSWDAPLSQLINEVEFISLSGSKRLDKQADVLGDKDEVMHQMLVV